MIVHFAHCSSFWIKIADAIMPHANAKGGALTIVFVMNITSQSHSWLSPVSFNLMRVIL